MTKFFRLGPARWSLVAGRQGGARAASSLPAVFGAGGGADAEKRIGPEVNARSDLCCALETAWLSLAEERAASIGAWLTSIRTLFRRCRAWRTKILLAWRNRSSEAPDGQPSASSSRRSSRISR